jgi:Amt family ammonium transporter
MLTGLFAAQSLGGSGFTVQKSIGSQLAVQALGVLAVALWCAVITWALLRVLDATLGLRVSDDQESEGLDVASHGERGYSM